MRAHIWKQRGRFFQARPRRIEIKTSTFQNAVGVTESATDGCLATTNASGAQPPGRFGKKEKAARYVNDPLDRLFSSRVSGARAQKKHTLDERANEKLNLL